jgi:hypothetical protein
VDTLGDILRGFHAWDVEQCLQGFAFPPQAPSQRPGLVLPSCVLVQEMVETRIPGPPLPHRWALRTPMGRVADMHFGLTTLQVLVGVTGGTEYRNDRMLLSF